MRRYSAEELQKLLEGTTEGVWSEERVGQVFRSGAFRPSAVQLMAVVKGDDGKASSDSNRPNAVLMAQARNFAVELLDTKTHRYGQEDCCGCQDRDAEIERLTDLIRHIQLHSNYRKCGYDQMTTPQKMLFDRIDAGAN